MLSCDLLVIGSGPGGYVAALAAAKKGLKTICVEKDPFFGGTCLNRGCIPTKALLSSAKVAYQCTQAEDYGVSISSFSINMKRMHERKQHIIDMNRKGIASLFKAQKVTSIHGTARFSSKNEVEVLDAKGRTTETITFKNALIATGSKPRRPGGLWVDHPRVMTSDEILFKDECPKKIAILGGGVIGLEFAVLYRDLGVDVSIFESLDDILMQADQTIRSTARRIFEKKRGIKIHCNSRVTSIEPSDDSVRVKFEKAPVSSAGKASDTTKFDETFDWVLMSVGRAPCAEDLLPGNAGVEVDRGGFIKVDLANFSTSTPHIFAIGDVITKTTGLAHAASAEASVVIDYITGSERTLIREHIPSVVYTHPEIAWVGATEASAQADPSRTFGVDTKSFPLARLAKAQIENETDGIVKIIVDKQYQEVIGIHIIGGPAGDMIAEAALGMGLEMTAVELSRTVHPHPTLSEGLMEVAHAQIGEAVHS